MLPNSTSCVMKAKAQQCCTVQTATFSVRSCCLTDTRHMCVTECNKLQHLCVISSRTSQSFFPRHCYCTAEQNLVRASRYFNNRNLCLKVTSFRTSAGIYILAFQGYFTFTIQGFLMNIFEESCGTRFVFRGLS